MPDKTRDEKKKTRESKQKKIKYTRTQNLRQENEAICDHNIVTDENETRERKRERE